MSFVRQSIWSLLTLVFGIAASVVLARALGPEARGEYQLAVKVAGLVLAFAQWGMPEVLLQMLADQRGRTGALVGTTFVMGAVGTVVAGAVALALFPLLTNTIMRGVDEGVVMVIVAGSVVAMVGMMARRFLQLAGHLAFYNWLDVVGNLVFLAVAVVLILLMPREALGAALAWVLSLVLVTALALWYCWRRVASDWSFDRSLAGMFLVAGLPVQVGVVATFVGNEAGAYVVNASLGLAEVGIYVVAGSVARLVLQVSMALRTALQPRLVSSTADSAAITVTVTRHGLLVMLVLSVALALAAPLVPVVFGSEFEGGGPVMALMLPGMVAYGLMQLLTGHLLRAGQRAVLAVSSWTFAVGSVLFQWLGISLAGLPGAAVGLSLAYVLSAAIVVGACGRVGGFRPRELLPRRADLLVYLALARQIRAARA